MLVVASHIHTPVGVDVVASRPGEPDACSGCVIDLVATHDDVVALLGVTPRDEDRAQGGDDDQRRGEGADQREDHRQRHRLEHPPFQGLQSEERKEDHEDDEDREVHRPRDFEGIVKFMLGDDEVYSRPLRFRDIASTSDLRTEIFHVVVFMEEWLADQER